ncbi:MAG: protein O-mannosyl-transferase family [Chloroflexota bacterium]
MKDHSKPLFPLHRLDFLLAAVTGVVSLALYIRTLAPSLLYGDMAEFQTLSYTLGMTHASGYPTQVVIGKLFTSLPFGNIAWRVNLMSAFFGALAVANLYLIARLMGGWRTAALLASLSMATSVFFWRRAIVAESYGPAAGMLSLVWLSVLLWRRTDKWGWLFLAGLAGGLSLGIHSTVIMTGASVLVYLLLTARKRSAWIGAAAGALLGLALTLAFFLYLDANDPPSSIYNTTYRTNLDVFGLTPEKFDSPTERLLEIFPTGSFWTYYFSAAPEEIERRILEYVNLFPRWQAAGILLGGLALFGLRKGNQWRWREGLYALIAFALIWSFAISVEFSVYQEFYVPAAVIAHAWLGMGASALLDGAEWLVKRKQAPIPGRSGVLVNLLGLALLVLSAWNARADLRLAVQEGTTTFIQAEKIYPHDPDRAVKEGLRILGKVEDNAIVFANWDRLYSYVYTAHVLEGRTGIALHQALGSPTPGTTMKAYIDANIETRPIYFTLDMPGLEMYYHVEQVEPQLFRITPKEP